MRGAGGGRKLFPVASLKLISRVSSTGAISHISFQPNSLIYELGIFVQPLVLKTLYY